MLKTFVIRLVANLLILGGFTILGITYLPILWGEAWYLLKSYKNQEYSLTASPQAPQGSVFSQYLTKDPVKIVPVNKEFSIVIEKINVNAPIVKNVSVIDEDSYNKALESGVAHAVDTAFPDERGNMFLFAHSAPSFFRFSKYSSVFNLLRKLEKGDKVHVFYLNRDYTYEVLDKEVVEGWDLRPLTRTSIEPVLTLQTCDPPGTTFNRLVVTARLIQVK